MDKNIISQQIEEFIIKLNKCKKEITNFIKGMEYKNIVFSEYYYYVSLVFVVGLYRW